MIRSLSAVTLAALLVAPSPSPADDGLAVSWKDDFLTIRGEFPGGELRIHYLEAYCRPGSTDRDWSETVIGHDSKLVETGRDHQRLVLKD